MPRDKVDSIGYAEERSTSVVIDALRKLSTSYILVFLQRVTPECLT